MKKAYFIHLLIVFIVQSALFSNSQTLQQQPFFFPSKLWKISCPGKAYNLVYQNLPMDIKVAINDAKSGDGVFEGDVFDLDKSYDNTPYYLYEGKYVIKPCSGSQEESIEITSQGLHFIYRAGIGLVYQSGKGSVRMFGKIYKLPDEEGGHPVGGKNAYQTSDNINKGNKSETHSQLSGYKLAYNNNWTVLTDLASFKCGKSDNPPENYLKITHRKGDGLKCFLSDISDKKTNSIIEISEGEVFIISKNVIRVYRSNDFGCHYFFYVYYKGYLGFVENIYLTEL